ncbi:hypothetical protein [Empedobacter brevis]|uniref:hypothetical protein n=1 Tax=Empedobacter brevis TaxID=247 RepID=UPI003340E341
MNNLAVIFAEGGLGNDFIYVVIFILAAFAIGFGLFSIIIAYAVNSFNNEKRSAKYYWSIFAICAVSSLLVSGLVCGSM